MTGEQVGSHQDRAGRHLHAEPPLARGMVSAFAEHHPGVDIVVCVVDGAPAGAPRSEGPPPRGTLRAAGRRAPSLEALVRFYERRLREEGAGTKAPRRSTPGQRVLERIALAVDSVSRDSLKLAPPDASLETLGYLQ